MGKSLSALLLVLVALVLGSCRREDPDQMANYKAEQIGQGVCFIG